MPRSACSSRSVRANVGSAGRGRQRALGVGAISGWSGRGTTHESPRIARRILALRPGHLRPVDGRVAGAIVILAVLFESAVPVVAMAWGASASPSASTSAEGVVDEDDGDGGGGGEAVGAEHSAAGRGAIQEQRQLLAELLGVGGAGLAGRFGEPRREGLLVVAGEDTCWMARVLDLDGRPDERAQRRVDLKDGEKSLAGG